MVNTFERSRDVGFTLLPVVNFFTVDGRDKKHPKEDA